jgi:hypothetical protein
VGLARSNSSPRQEQVGVAVLEIFLHVEGKVGHGQAQHATRPQHAMALAQEGLGILAEQALQHDVDRAGGVRQGLAGIGVADCMAAAERDEIEVGLVDQPEAMHSTVSNGQRASRMAGELS